MKKIYLVKDLARETGHSVNAVKFYLRENLLKEFARSPYTNFRFFDESAVERLNNIRELRKKGLALSQIKKALGTN